MIAILVLPKLARRLIDMDIDKDTAAFWGIEEKKEAIAGEDKEVKEKKEVKEDTDEAQEAEEESFF